MADSPNLVVLTAENFHSVVIEGSRRKPVLVDFWAEWCAPCRTLMPILAKLADEYSGRLTVAKLDTEREQDVAAQLGIRSLPTVQLVKDGQVIDQFMGALPEAQVREFLERHLPRESDALLTRVRALLDADQIAEARALLDQAQAMDPENARLVPARASVQAAAGDFEGAEETLARVPIGIADDPEVLALRGRLHFARLAAGAPTAEALSSRLETNPGDGEARYLLATRYAAKGHFGDALEQLLSLVRTDRAYGDDAARKAMVMIFDLLGGEGDLVARYRAKMLSALY
jgi:putative thioredoxin